jgi:CPA2 family monovalent cation:H+ antiporter-2
MLLNPKIIIQHPFIIIGTTIVILIIKFVINTGSLLTLGYPIRIAATSGLAIAQVGEFSFVLERAGRSAGLNPAGLGELGSQIFIFVSVLLMIASPFLFNLAPKVGKKLSNTRLNRWGEKLASKQQSSEDNKLENHSIIVGYGPAGRHLVQVLSHGGIPFVVIEMNPNSVQEMREQQIPVIYGDATRVHILQQAGVKKAKLGLIATNDPRSTPRILNQARFLNPTIQLIVRTRYLDKVAYLEEKGADIVVPEEMQTTVRLFTHVLRAYMVPQQEIDQYISEIRSDDYEMMRHSIKKSRFLALKNLGGEGLLTRTVTIRKNAPIAGKTLGETQFRNKYGITILAVKRGEEQTGNPAGDFRLKAGDQLVMMAEAQRFEASKELFRETETE